MAERQSAAAGSLRDARCRARRLETDRQQWTDGGTHERASKRHRDGRPTVICSASPCSRLNELFTEHASEPLDTLDLQ